MNFFGALIARLLPNTKKSGDLSAQNQFSMKVSSSLGVQNQLMHSQFLQDSERLTTTFEQYMRLEIPAITMEKTFWSMGLEPRFSDYILTELFDYFVSYAIELANLVEHADGLERKPVDVCFVSIRRDGFEGAQNAVRELRRCKFFPDELTTYVPTYFLRIILGHDRLFKAIGEFKFADDSWFSLSNDELARNIKARLASFVTDSCLIRDQGLRSFFCEAVLTEIGLAVYGGDKEQLRKTIQAYSADIDENGMVFIKRLEIITPANARQIGKRGIF